MESKSPSQKISKTKNNLEQNLQHTNKTQFLNTNHKLKHTWEKENSYLAVIEL